MYHDSLVLILLPMIFIISELATRKVNFQKGTTFANRVNKLGLVYSFRH